jgi:heme exporter protein C
LALAGAVNLPVIVFSVQWWNTLHQGNTISFSGGSKIYITMLYPLLISTLGFYLAFITMVVARIAAAICERKTASAVLAAAER